MDVPTRPSPRTDARAKRGVARQPHPLRGAIAHRLPLAAALALVLASAGCAAFGLARPMPSPPPAPAATRDGRWQQDIAYLEAELPRLHPGTFARVSQPEWEAAAHALSERVPQLQDHEVVVGLVRLAALLHDEHTGVEWPPAPRDVPPAPPTPGGLAPVLVTQGDASTAFGRYPLRLRSFSDGVFAIETTAQGAVALGGRLLAVGGVTVDEAVARAAALTARVNESLVSDQVPQLLVMPAVLAALGLADGTSNATYLFARPPVPPDDGPPSDEPLSPTVELTLAPMRLGNRYDWRRSPDPPPLADSHAERTHWWQSIPAQHAVFAQCNACREDPAQPFADFARELLAALDGMPGARLVLDLRRNGGGDSSVLQPLLDGLAERPALTGARLAVLIGPGTYSSALMNAWTLRRQFGARLFGAPTGGTPDGWGEVQAFVLPNSGLRVHHSTRRFALEPGADSLRPDVLVPGTSADWFAGRDAALEAALAAEP